MRRIVYSLILATLALGAAHSQSAGQKALFDRYVAGAGFDDATVGADGSAIARDVNVHNAATGALVGPVAKTTNQYVDYVIRSASGRGFAVEDYAFLAYTEYLGPDGRAVAVSTVSGTLKAGEAAAFSAIVKGGTLVLNDVFRVVHERGSLEEAKEGPERAPDAKTYESARYLHVYAFVLRDADGRKNAVRILDEHTVGSGGKKF